MNYSLAALLLSDEVRTVSVVYSSGRKRSSYTYKTVTPDLEVGDIVIVQSDSVESKFGMSFAKVVALDPEVDFQSDIEYKWVLGKVDLSSFEHVLENEKELISQVRTRELRARREQLRQAMNMQGMEKMSLLEVRTSDDSPSTPEDDDTLPHVEAEPEDKAYEPRILVLARSKAHFDRAKKDGILPERVFYVHNLGSLYGYWNRKYICLTGWHTNGDYDIAEIKERLRISNCEEVEIDC